MTVEFREIETVVLNVEPHPNDVKKGNFAYWNDLAILAGINLNEEALNASEQEYIRCCEGDYPIP